jgi:hypothetical protein
MQHVASLSLKEDYILLFHMLCHIYQKEGRKQTGNKNKGRKKWWIDNGRARGAENGKMKRNKLVK